MLLGLIGTLLIGLGIWWATSSSSSSSTTSTDTPSQSTTPSSNNSTTTTAAAATTPSNNNSTTTTTTTTDATTTPSNDTPSSVPVTGLVTPVVVSQANGAQLTPKPAPYVEFYADCNYQGASSKLGAGSYNIGQMGIPNDSLSAMKVGPNTSVTVYELDNLQGGYFGIHNTSNQTILQPCLISENWNDKASSIKIESAT